MARLDAARSAQYRTGITSQAGFASDCCESDLRPYMQVVLGDGSKGVQACPGEALNESLVDVRQTRVSKVITQVVQIGPGTVGTHQLADGLGVGKGFVPGSYPQPV